VSGRPFVQNFLTFNFKSTGVVKIDVYYTIVSFEKTSGSKHD
jgi:hypothetical protein